MKKKKEGEKGRGVLLSCENQNKQTNKQNPKATTKQQQQLTKERCRYS